MRASTKPWRSRELMEGQEKDLAEGLYDPDVGRENLPGGLIMRDCECQLVTTGNDNAMSGTLALSAETRKRPEEGR